ncbi:MAG: MaoC/PaaZ C-terminal domain-containing protein [Anaerolineae bacterium]
MAPSPRGMYFEEFEVGLRIATASRTITEADIVSFAGLTGDYNQLHTDAEFAAETPYGKRVAHGVLTLSYALGLAVQQGFIEGTTLAFRELSWKFNAPVFIGDTIHLETEVVETKPMRRLGGGLVVLKARVVNQKGETAQRGEWRVLMASRPEG